MMGPKQPFSSTFGVMSIEADEDERKRPISALTVNKGAKCLQLFLMLLHQAKLFIVETARMFN